MPAWQQHGLHAVLPLIHSRFGHRGCDEQGVWSGGHSRRGIRQPARDNDFDDMLFAEFRVGAGYGLGEEVCQRIPKLVQVRFGQVEHTRRRFESGEVHIKFSHTPIYGEHGLKNAVATGKSLVFHADKRLGGVYGNALRVL